MGFIGLLRYDSLDFREEGLWGAAFGETNSEKVVMVGLKACGEVGAQMERVAGK